MCTEQSAATNCLLFPKTNLIQQIQNGMCAACLRHACGMCMACVRHVCGMCATNGYFNPPPKVIYTSYLQLEVITIIHTGLIWEQTFADVDVYETPI